ncbi:hypothetical protein GCM10027075_31830 [Streptomyces heilongjiangensis]
MWGASWGAVRRTAREEADGPPHHAVGRHTNGALKPFRAPGVGCLTRIPDNRGNNRVLWRY